MQNLPMTRTFWAITDEGQVVEVAFSDDTKSYTGEEVWSRVDGENGSWSAEEIVDWAWDPNALDHLAALTRAGHELAVAQFKASHLLEALKESQRTFAMVLDGPAVSALSADQFWAAVKAAEASARAAITHAERP